MNRGMTIVEIIVVLGIFGLIVIAISTFQRNVIVNNRAAQESLSSIQDARVILRTMTKELRTASPSSNGAYAIAQAGTSSITFFSDVQGDGIKEQIRYYVSSTTLKRGQIIPTGSPLVYNSAQETFSNLAYNIKNTATTSLFEYFDSTYAGTSSPMVQPVTTTNIRLIKINLTLDKKSYTSQVSPRNLKDNL